MRCSRFQSKNVITEGDNFWWEICQYVNIMFLSIYVIQQWNFNMQNQNLIEVLRINWYKVYTLPTKINK